MSIGPFVSIAAFVDECETNKDGSLHLGAVRAQYFVPELPLLLHFKLALVFVPSGSTGEHALRVRIVRPNGEVSDDPEIMLTFKRNQRVAFMEWKPSIFAVEYGVYWAEIFLNDVLKTRVPMRVRLARSALSEGQVFH
jgi:hypothetical protein